MRGLIGSLAVVTCVSGGAAADPIGDALRGERQFQRCFACHSVDPGETAKLQGPNLFRVLGRPAGVQKDFEYSDAFARWARPGTVWTSDLLDRLLADPDALIPGTRMAMPGLAELQDRIDIIAYLIAAGRGTP